MTAAVCQACGAPGPQVFYRQSRVPANSCLLLDSEKEAISFPVGELELALCDSCGFIGNIAFDPDLAEYSDRYEETQGFSPRFLEFAGGLARTWVDRYDLSGRHVVEIGCGKGEFLTLMAEAGIGSGLGIDPGVDPKRIDSPAADRLAWDTGLFDESYGPLEAAAVVCRHTLEHIPDVGRFLRLLRTALDHSPDTVLLFEVPDTMRVLEEGAFWDVYYEHCSYFTMGSLVRLFRACGFDVLDARTGYDGQYLLIEARPAEGTGRGSDIEDIDRIRRGVESFVDAARTARQTWDERLADISSGGGRSLIWGASSKGVAFLVTMDGEVSAAVDINPNKHGKFMAGTGHEIVGPERVPALDPQLVVVMNPIYVDEITADLRSRGVDAAVAAV